jgi:thiosulfate/3-mercaptopyruvate sulfurtransferase
VRSAATSVVVSTDWLQANLGAPWLCLVDVRGQVLPPGSKPRYLPKRGDYLAAHVPGAIFVDWTQDIVDTSDPVPVQIAKATRFAARMGELGIGDEALVVAYDDYNHVFSGRLSWALRYYGHDAVRVLDGGWALWVAEGRPTSSDVVVRPPARFTPSPRSALRRTADEVMNRIGSPDVLLLDARAPEQYTGQVTAAGRGGHIPGALNVHYTRLVDPATGRFRNAEDLARVFAAAGVDVEHLPADVVVYCNGGVSCSVPLNALRLLGREDVAVYDGSWNEWGSDDGRPIRIGGEP